MKSAEVLVIDDEKHVREVLARLIEKGGYVCRQAGGGERGLAMLSEGDVSVVVCDYSMPDLTGDVVLHRIRRSHPAMPVIMLTAYAEVDLATSLMREGAFDFLTKPVTGNRLLSCIARAVDHGALLARSQMLEDENRRYQRQLEKKVIEQTFQITTQAEFVNRLNALQDLDSVVQVVERFTRELVGCAAFSLLIRQEEGYDLQQVYGIDSARMHELAVNEGDELFLKKLAQDRIMHVDRSDIDRLRVPAEFAAQGGFTVAVALNLETMLFGIMTLRFERRDALSDNDLRNLAFLADSASIAIHNQLSRMKIETGYMDTIRALALAVEAKDPYTRGHSDRVRCYGETTARRLNLPESEIKMINFAGVLHDIGKIGVPIEIIHKEGKLTDEEFENIKRHPSIGEQLIKDIAFLAKARKVIRHHHERWDGRGYPDGLRGEEIPLGARILAVADCFDAMTTDRPYRKAFTAEQAIHELVRCAGRQFDRNCVRAFLEIPADLLCAKENITPDIAGAFAVSPCSSAPAAP